MRPKVVLYYNDLVFKPSETFLFKDFGQVPFVLSELNDTDLEYWISVANRNPDFYCFRGKSVRQFSKTLRMLPQRLDLFKNAQLYRRLVREETLTHLIVFPFTPVTDLMVARCARRHRPDVRICLKLDTNRAYLEALAADWNRYRRSPARFLRQHHHYRELLRMADLVLCETDYCEHLLRDGFMGLDLSSKLTKTYSGVSEKWLASIGVEDVPIERRRQSIIVSGRLSSWQKYTALIFEAGPPPPGWKIEFIGEIDEDLRAVIEAWRTRDPKFDDHYHFHGPINDKRTYFGTLMNAQALLMNSRGGEGFPNVFAEAHYCRLFIVTSDVSGAAEATGDGTWGVVYPPEDASALRAALQTMSVRIEKAHGPAVPEEFRHRFIWEHSLNQPTIRDQFATRKLAGPR